MEIKKVKIIDMRVDEKVQRYESEVVVQKIASKFDIKKVGLLTVSKREDGLYYIIDGQHRMKAASLNGVEELDSLVHTGLTIQDEANLFLALNKDRKLPTAIDNFKVAVTAGQAVECAVNNIFEKYDISVDKKRKGILMTSPTVCVEIYTRYGEEALDYTLHTLLGAWGLGSIRGNAIRAMGSFLGQHIEEIDIDDLINRLSKACFATVMQEVEKLKIVKGFTRREALEVLIYQAYNKGRKNKLAKGNKVF